MELILIAAVGSLALSRDRHSQERNAQKRKILPPKPSPVSPPQAPAHDGGLEPIEPQTPCRAQKKHKTNDELLAKLAALIVAF